MCFELYKFKFVKCCIICEIYFKYYYCMRIINKSFYKKEYICGEKYCKICNDYVDENY